MKFKKITFIFLLYLFFTNNSSGQSYSPLVDTNFTWNIAEGDFIWFWSTKKYKIGQDTMINSVQYQKLYKEDFINPPVSLSLVAFIREDYSKKVYIIRYPDYESLGESLLYNFGLSVGDSIENISYYPSYDNNKWKVISIDTVSLLSGNKRARWSLSNSQGDYDIWIEGIGSTKGLLYAGEWGIVCPSTKLLCYYINQTLMYKNDSNCVESNVSVNDYPANHLAIYPTITNDKIYLINFDFNYEIEVEIYNSFNILVARVNLKNNEIDVNLLQSGVYFLKVITKYNSKSIFKFIKI